MSGYFQFFCPVKILSGDKALDHLPYELACLGARRPLLISDAGVVGAGLLRPLTDALAESETVVGGVYDAVPPDSSLDTVLEVANVYRDRGCDALLAVGGGSVLDTAKAVNIVLSENTTDLAAFSGAGVLKRPLGPLAAVPTTAGTGSEVTNVTVIADPAHDRKMPFVSPFLLPDLAVIDLRMTLTLPPAITAATGMDALTHATEAYTCLAKNPMSDAYAFAAVKMIGEHLLSVARDPRDGTGRMAMANASTLAGIAFANSMVGLVHMLGHALGAICHLPHGVAMSILLPHALDYNLRQADGTYRSALGELFLALVGADRYARTAPAERPERFVAQVREMKEELHEVAGLPRTLAETGKVPRDRLGEIAKSSLGDAASIFNPVEVDLEDAGLVLERAYEAC